MSKEDVSKNDDDQITHLDLNPEAFVDVDPDFYFDRLRAFRDFYYNSLRNKNSVVMIKDRRKIMNDEELWDGGKINDALARKKHSISLKDMPENELRKFAVSVAQELSQANVIINEHIEQDAEGIRGLFDKVEDTGRFLELEEMLAKIECEQMDSPLYKNLRHKIKKLNSEIVQLKGKSSPGSNKEKELNSKIKRLENELSQATEMLGKFSNNPAVNLDAGMFNTIVAQADRAQDAENQAAAARKEAEDAKAIADRAKAEKEAAGRQLADIRADLGLLKQKYLQETADLTGKVSAADAAKAALEQDFKLQINKKDAGYSESLVKVKADYDAKIAEQAEEANRKISDLEEKISKLDSRIEELTKSETELKAAVTQKDAGIAELNSKEQAYLKNIDALGNEIASLKQEKSRLEDTAVKLKSEVEQLKPAAEKLQEKVAELTGEISEIREEAAKNEQNYADLIRAKDVEIAVLKPLDEQSKAQEETIKQLREEKENEYLPKIEELESKKSELTAEVAGLNEKIKNVENDIKATVDSQVAELTQGFDAGKKELAERNASLLAEKAELESENQNLEKELNTYKDGHDSLVNAKESAEDKATTLEGTVNDLQVQIAGLAEQAETQKQSYDVVINAKEVETAGLLERNKQLADELESARQGAVSDEDMQKKLADAKKAGEELAENKYKQEIEQAGQLAKALQENKSALETEVGNKNAEIKRLSDLIASNAPVDVEQAKKDAKAEVEKEYKNQIEQNQRKVEALEGQKTALENQLEELKKKAPVDEAKLREEIEAKIKEEYDSKIEEARKGASADADQIKKDAESAADAKYAGRISDLEKNLEDAKKSADPEALKKAVEAEKGKLEKAYAGDKAKLEQDIAVIAAELENARTALDEEKLIHNPGEIQELKNQVAYYMRQLSDNDEAHKTIVAAKDEQIRRYKKITEKNQNSLSSLQEAYDKSAESLRQAGSIFDSLDNLAAELSYAPLCGKAKEAKRSIKDYLDFLAYLAKHPEDVPAKKAVSPISAEDDLGAIVVSEEKKDAGALPVSGDASGKRFTAQDWYKIVRCAVAQPIDVKIPLLNAYLSYSGIKNGRVQAYVLGNFADCAFMKDDFSSALDITKKAYDLAADAFKEFNAEFDEYQMKDFKHNMEFLQKKLKN